MSTYTDITTKIDNLTDGGENTAAEVRAILYEIRDNSFMIGEVKEFDKGTDWIASNFDSTGLGINGMVGFALANGQNGTKNRNGRTAIGYDPVNYDLPGTVLGEATHTLTKTELPNINILIPYQTGFITHGGSEHTLQYNQPQDGQMSVPLGGSGLAHNNMQPSIVTIFVQRIA